MLNFFVYRMVAKYLRRNFLNQKERAEEEMLNLSRIVEGRTKKESARFFYEILVCLLCFIALQ